MTKTETFNLETMTVGAKDVFSTVFKKKLNFIPNLIKVFGNSLVTLKAHVFVGETKTKGNFTLNFENNWFWL